MKISVKNLSFSYGKTPILKNISLDIKESNIICLVGPNGSGKTTFIKCIGKILEPDGYVKLDGNNIKNMKRNVIAQNISYVPQIGVQINAVNVIDVIMMGRMPYIGFKTSSSDIEWVEKAIKILNLEQLADKQYNELSGGQQQKVLIARAIAQNPKVLLLDEPTNSLDIRHQLETLAVVYNFSRNFGVTVIMAIHDLTIAARYADYLVMLKNGELIAYDTPDQLITTAMIEEVYGIESKIYKDEEIGIVVIPVKAKN